MTINKNRYDRQIRMAQVGETGQEKLAHARILIVGVGALGTYAAEQLTRAGIGSLVLIDNDVVEESNLQRQTLFTASHLGQAKVFSAAQELHKIRSDIKIEARKETFDTALFEDFGQLDLVLDCTDNFLARQLINTFCLHHALPFVFASAAGTSGQVMALQARNGPCLSCVFPDLLELERNCETVGVITPLIPLVSSLQISLALQILLTPEKVDWELMQVVESWPISLTTFHVKKRATCEICSQNSAQENLFSRSCGGVFQGILPDLAFERFVTFCQIKNWDLTENPLAFRVKFDGHEITVFRNGRLLFYHFTMPEAQQIFEEIKNYE